MTTKQTVPVIDGKEQVPTGYDTAGNDPSTFYIPPCGIEDVDVAMHTLFDEEIKFKPYQQSTTGFQKEINLKKPYVIVSTGERFAMSKRLRPSRDRNGVIALPAISIRRTGIEQKTSDVFPGEMTIKRRFDPSDVDYQKLVNTLALKNIPGSPASARVTGSGKNLESIREGMLLDTTPEELRGNHVYEIITVPFPQFFTATYDVVFWTNYTQHMNYMIEVLLSSQITPGKGFYLKTPKGYWFSAQVDTSMAAQDNAEEMTDEERIIKYGFKITVRGFLLAPDAASQRVPFKRYLSNVNISFETFIGEPQGTVSSEDNISNFDETLKEPTESDPYLLTDIQQDRKDRVPPTEQSKILFERTYRDIRGTVKTKTIREVSGNQKKGETVYSASDLETLATFFSG